MEATAITAAVLTYNSGRTLEACLRSLAAQTHPLSEVLVVDDDSDDATVALATSVAEQVGLPLRVLRNGARNISRGRNIAIDSATTPIVAFLDSDATAEPHWAEALAAAFAGQDQPSVVGGEVVAAHATPFAEALAVNDSAVRDLFARGTLLVSGCNMAVHVDRVDGARFDEAWVHAEDIEFLHRACATHPWAVAPDAVVHHESRATPRGYLRQMFRYGAWKTRYVRRTGDHRLVDYVPSAVMVASVLLAPVVPQALLALPALCLAEASFIVVARRPRPSSLGWILLGWIVKNVGWGAGILRGLAGQPRRAAPAFSGST